MAWNTNDKQAMKKADDNAKEIGVLTQQLADTEQQLIDSTPINTLHPPNGLEPATGNDFAKKLNAIIDYALANKKEIEIAPGEYLINEPINFKIGLRLRGLGEVRLRPANGYNGKIFDNIEGVIKDNIYIENILIIGNGTTIGINFLGIARATLKKVRVTNCAMGLVLESTNGSVYSSYNRITECRFDHNDIGVRLHAYPNGWVNLNTFVQVDVDHNRINVDVLSEGGGTSGQVIQNAFYGSEMEGHNVDQAVRALGRYIECHFDNCWFEPMHTEQGVLSAERVVSSERVTLTFNNCHGLSRGNFRIYKGNIAHVKGGAEIIVDGENISDIHSFYRNNDRTNLFANSGLDVNGTTPTYNNIKIDGITYLAEHETTRWVDCGKVYQWKPDTQFRKGDFVIPTMPNGHIYKCIVGGTTGNVEPYWATDEITDQTASWIDAGVGMADDIGALRITVKEWAGVRATIPLPASGYSKKRRFAFVFYLRGDERNTGVTTSTEGTLNGADESLKKPPNTKTYNRHIGTSAFVDQSATQVFYNIYPSNNQGFTTLYLKDFYVFEIYQ